MNQAVGEFRWTATLGCPRLVRGWLKKVGSDDERLGTETGIDDDDELGTWIEIDDEYDHYAGMGIEKQKGMGMNEAL